MKHSHLTSSLDPETYMFRQDDYDSFCGDHGDARPPVEDCWPSIGAVEPKILEMGQLVNNNNSMRFLYPLAVYLHKLCLHRL